MKIFKLVLGLLLLTLLASCNRKTAEIDQSVNAVIGDVSYLESFGNQPTIETHEDVRLQTHLRYVEQLLRTKDVSKLTKTQQANRLKMLDLLNEYWATGIFPKNYDYPDKRMPCFIDKDGNICAVGYLIAQTAGRQAAEEINSKFKYEYLLAMNDKAIDSWIEVSGLTKEECAMIQPTYGTVPNYNNISPQYGIPSALISGLNVSLNTINSIQISKGTNSRDVALLGLVTGATQIVMGANNHPQLQPNSYANPAQRNLSLLNIGLGASTLVLSSCNLITNKKRKEKSLSWNIYSIPTQDSSMGLAFSLTKRI